jgi:RNA polymerase sigma-70 factor (ECF subfamily)
MHLQTAIASSPRQFPILLFMKNKASSRLLAANDLKGVPDQELISLTLAGDARGFEALVRKYQKLVYNVVYDMVKSHEYAADLTQETFLKAYQNLSSFRIGAPFKPWLLRIATNSALNSIRYNKLHNHESLDEVLETNPTYEPPSSESVEATVELKITQAMLQDALEHLSVRGRLAFTLRYHHDLPYDEIAAVMEAPVTTVKSLLFKTREKIRTILENKIAL